MQIKVLRAFYGDEKGVKAGDVIEVSDARGRQLIQRKLAVKFSEAESEQTSVAVVENQMQQSEPELPQVTNITTQDGAAVDIPTLKADETPANKQDAQPENKAAAAHDKKAK